MRQRAIGEAQDDRIGIIGGHEGAALGSNGKAPSAFFARHDENAGQLAALVAARFDAQRHVLTQLGEFAHLDRRAQRTRAKFEPEPFIGVARRRLDEADNHQVEDSKEHRIHERHAQQPPIALPHCLQHIKFGRERELAEGEQDAEQHADGNAQ